MPLLVRVCALVANVYPYRATLGSVMANSLASARVTSLLL